MQEEGKGHIYGSWQGSSMETTWNYKESPSLPSKAGSGTYSTLTGHGHLEGHVHSPCSKLEVLSWCSKSFIS